MKRAQINLHRFVWMVMGPLLAAIIIGALLVRPSPDVGTNDDLTFMSEEAR